MTDYDRIADVIRFLRDNRMQQPELATVADHVGSSPFHLHRLFSRWAGITPKSFLQCLTLTHARRLLQNGERVLDASLDVGLSGPGRLHDLCVTLEAASPGEVKSGGAGWTIRAGFADSPFGTCLIGSSPRGICHLSFIATRDRQAGEEAIRLDWPRATITWNDGESQQIAESLFVKTSERTTTESLRAFVRGTSFQVRVWRALLSIPEGSLVSYGQLAESVCSRRSARAVGSAVAANRLAFLIPCHRVIRETGVFGDYRWGPERKQAMMAWESAGMRVE